MKREIYLPKKNLETKHTDFEEKKMMSQSQPSANNEAGFSLMEAVIALVIFLITVFGIIVTFTYAVNYNAGNSSRAQALAIAQQEIEQLRSAKFTPSVTDGILDGGIREPRTVTAPDGSNYLIETIVDDDPLVDGVQIEDSNTLKEITLKVSLDRPSPGWQTAIPAEIVLRRVRAN